MSRRLRAALNTFAKVYITEMLVMYKWNKPKTAEVLGIGLSTLYKKIKEMKIERR